MLPSAPPARPYEPFGPYKPINRQSVSEAKQGRRPYTPEEYVLLFRRFS